MKKLRLNVETLTVDTFATEPARRRAGGTVHGLATQNWATCNPLVYSCNCAVTVDATCMEPCGTTLCQDTPTCAEG